MEDCLSCEAGQYCQGTGNTKPTGLCDPGYYCPKGQNQSNPDSFVCTPGHYCPKGSQEQKLCDPGTWTDLQQQSQCKICLEGFYCSLEDAKKFPITDYSLYPCPVGFFCPNNTMFATQFGCPNGSYGNGLKLTQPSQCLACPPGKYCLGQLNQSL